MTQLEQWEAEVDKLEADLEAHQQHATWMPGGYSDHQLTYARGRLAGYRAV